VDAALYSDELAPFLLRLDPNLGKEGPRGGTSGGGGGGGPVGLELHVLYGINSDTGTAGPPLPVDFPLPAAATVAAASAAAAAAVDGRSGCDGELSAAVRCRSAVALLCAHAEGSVAAAWAEAQRASHGCGGGGGGEGGGDDVGKRYAAAAVREAAFAASQSPSSASASEGPSSSSSSSLLPSAPFPPSFPPSYPPGCATLLRRCAVRVRLIKSAAEVQRLRDVNAATDAAHIQVRGLLFCCTVKAYVRPRVPRLFLLTASIHLLLLLSSSSPSSSSPSSSSSSSSLSRDDS